MSFAFLVKFCCLFVIHLLTKIPRDKLNVSDRADVVEDVLHRLPLVVVNGVGKLVGNDCSRPGPSSLPTLRLGGVGYATICIAPLHPHQAPASSFGFQVISGFSFCHCSALPSSQSPLPAQESS